MLNSIYRFRQYWEEFEQSKLIADRDALMTEKAADAEDFTEDILNEWRDKEENRVQDKVNPP